MTQMQLPAVWRELAWGAVSVILTAIAFWYAAWSYPQGHDTIWTIGGVTMAAVALLSAREVMRVGAAETTR